MGYGCASSSSPEPHAGDGMPSCEGDCLTWILNEVISKIGIHLLHHNINDRGAVRGITI